MGRSRMSILKRQREVKKAEKARIKRAKRQGRPEEVFTEPQPTVRLSELSSEPDSPEESGDANPEKTPE